jgi:hypothetical protein
MHFTTERTQVFKMASVPRTIKSVFISWSTDRFEESSHRVVIWTHFRFLY